MDWTVQAVVALVAVLVTVGSLVLTRRADRRVRRADLLRQYTSDFHDKQNLVETFARIDSHWSSNGQAANDWPSDPAELTVAEAAALVHLLDYLNTVGSAHAQRALPIDDLAGTTIGYMTFRVWHHPGARAYLELVWKSDGESGFMGAGFRYFYTLALSLERFSVKKGGAEWERRALLRARSALRYR